MVEILESWEEDEKKFILQGIKRGNGNIIIDTKIEKGQEAETVLIYEDTEKLEIKNCKAKKIVVRNRGLHKLKDVIIENNTFEVINVLVGGCSVQMRDTKYKSFLHADIPYLTRKSQSSS